MNKKIEFGTFWFAIVLYMVFAVGCGSPPTQPVNVNLRLVSYQMQVKSHVANSVQSIGSYSSGAKLNGKQFTIYGASALQGETGSAGASAHVRRVLAEAKKQTYANLMEQFKSIYTNEANALRLRKLNGFTPLKQAIYAKAIAEITANYKSYSDQRGPILASLTVLTGFPDPGVPKNGIYHGTLLQAPYYRKRAVALRAKIQALDAHFQSEFTAQMMAAKRDQDEALNQLLMSIKQQIGDINQRASDAARQEVMRSSTELGPLLSESPPGQLAAVPSHSLSIQGSEVVPMAISSGQPSSSISIQPANLKPYLDIWLNVNGYRLSKVPSATDKTTSFIKWILKNYPETFSSH